ncbi:MAG: hypothetical protein R3Y68_03700 [Rikenellaceae bacterium]
MIFLFPTPFEAVKFLELHPDAKIVICGVGMAAAAATMAEIAPKAAGKRVILAGIAGSYDTDKIAVGSVVECVSERIEEMPMQYSSIYHTTPRWGLTEARSNSVNRSNCESHQCEVENMEGAAVAAICQRLQIEYSQIRAISNRVGADHSEWEIDRAVEALTDTLSHIYSSK